MNVLLTFDVEIWCNGWSNLDDEFSASFERYIYGISNKGNYGLPKTLEILDRHGLKAVFFVEPLFATRFGIEHLTAIVELLKDAGQEIQLHLHPEWTDEAKQALLPNAEQKRQHLSLYSLDEQRTLIAHGIQLLQEAGARRPTAFRAGSFACNEDTFAAVAANGLRFDSSINPALPTSRPGKILDDRAGCCEPFEAAGVTMIPMSNFSDGFGQPRHAQIGACSARELAEAMAEAQRAGWRSFVLLSHSFELMVPGKSIPDPIVVRRFEKTCRFLAENRALLPTCGFDDLPLTGTPRGLPLPTTSRFGTITRYVEQGVRRFL